MRWWVLAAVAALSSLSIHAAEPGIEAALLADAFGGEPAVVVSPIPMPAAVTELLQPANPAAKVLKRGKAKVALKKPLPTLALSRTERRQIALLAPSLKSGEAPLRKQLRDENGQSGYDDIPLHRSFSRPRLAETDDAEEVQDFDAIPGHVGLRLLLARMKAVEAHILARAARTQDDAGQPLPASVAQRLAQARTLAVEAHRNKYG